MASASADTDGGYNSWFPDAGEYDCVIEGLYIGECTGKEWVDGNATEYPGTLIKFNFRLIDDPGSPESPRAFDGSPFILPVNGPDVLQTEKGQNQLNRTISRLKGHLSSILGMQEIPDLAAALSQVEKTLQSEPIAVKVKANVWVSQAGKKYNTEYISSRLG
jgi:hypothetical protein